MSGWYGWALQQRCPAIQRLYGIHILRSMNRMSQTTVVNGFLIYLLGLFIISICVHNRVIRIHMFRVLNVQSAVAWEMLSLDDNDVWVEKGAETRGLRRPASLSHYFVSSSLMYMIKVFQHLWVSQLPWMLKNDCVLFGSHEVYPILLKWTKNRSAHKNMFYIVFIVKFIRMSKLLYQLLL